MRYNNRMLKKLKAYLITGLLVLIPFVATAAVVWKAFSIFDGWIQYFGIHIPGAGIAFLLTVLILTGMIVRNYVGKKAYQFADWLMRKVPLANKIYTAARELSQTIFSDKKRAFQAVVALEFAGQKTIGFITGDPPEAIYNALRYEWEQEKPPYKMVYVMQAFSPAAGYVVMVPESKLSKVDMSVEAAMKLILTGGMVKDESAAPPITEGVLSGDDGKEYRVAITEIKK